MGARARPAAPLAWMLLLFYLSSLPSSSLPQTIPGLDKLVHFVEYALLAALWSWALAPRLAARPVFIASVIISFLYGVADEIHQLFVPGRSFEVGDILANCAGALAGSWLAMPRRAGR